MKSILCVVVCAFSLLAFASTAQSGGAEASGDFTFNLGTAVGTVHFAGHIDHKTATPIGQISFNATVDVSNEVCWPVSFEPTQYACEPIGDDTGAGLPQETVALNFQIDRMVVTDNRAAMSATIGGESPFAGLHTILAVEDAGGNNKGFTWGVYKTKIVNTTAKDYDYCPNYTPPTEEELGTCGEGEIQFPCPAPPPPGCFFDGLVINDQNVPSYSLTYTASDYELCPYPPPSDTVNFVPPDPHNYACFTGNPDPHGRPAGIPVEATLTITDANSFPLFTYPMTPMPQGGGNKLSVKDNS